MKNICSDRIRNVAIVGHGGSGKTMLVEHLLFTAGVTDRVGTTETGSTQSDFDPLEVKRHISMSASVMSLEWHDTKINLIDVPGFPDFSADLHAVARVVESMIIVCEAKRDIDVGFELAYEVAQTHGLATCVFVNKLERDNADFDGLMDTLHDRFGQKVVSTQIPFGIQASFSGVLDLLNMKLYRGKDRGEDVSEIPAEYAAEAEVRHEKMMDAAAVGDDDLALKYLEGESLTPAEVEHGLMVGIECGKVVPVLLGSAHTGVGVATLLDRIVGELPSPKDFADRQSSTTSDETEMRLPPDDSKEPVAFCFKTSADPFVGRINYFRVFSGTMKHDQVLWNSDSESEERIHHLAFPHGKSQEPAQVVVSGDICAVTKLAITKTSDTLCLHSKPVALPKIVFPEPIYRLAVHPKTKADEDKLGGAIAKILEEDPSLRYSRDPGTQQEVLEGMGDVHLEAVIEKLKVKFGVTVETEEAQVPFRETVRSKSRAQGRHKRQSGGKGQFGDCWIDLEPLERGAGFIFENKVVGGAIPKNFIPAIEKGIVDAMHKGFISGFPAVDLKVTVFDGSYHDVDSNEMAFKTAGELAIREAFTKANPVMLEPYVDLTVTVPDQYVGDVSGDLNGRKGRLQGIEAIGGGKSRIQAKVPYRSTQRYALELRSMTKGRGHFRQSFSHYEEVSPEFQKTMVTA